jgi:hypothetical protein
MRKLFYILLFSFLFKVITGQVNLVPNPSFEDYYSCPSFQNELYKTKNWFNSGYTPDYYNSCCNNCDVSIPINVAGFQHPASGIAYVGFAGFLNTIGLKNKREFISVQLLTPLVIGQKYFTSFKVSGAYKTGTGMFFNNSLGILFTKYKLDSLSGNTPNKFHIIETSVINDTLNWVKIKGSFVADSNYTYMTIGNLRDSSLVQIDSNITFQETIPSTFSYYYCDDVCVSTDSLYAYNYVPNNLSRIIRPEEKSLRIFPNPTSQKITIKSEGVIGINIINNQGQLIKHFSVKGEMISINVENLPDGIYIIETLFSKQPSCRDKLIIKK